MTNKSASPPQRRAANQHTDDREVSLSAACEELLLRISQHFLDRGIGVAEFVNMAKIAYIRAAVTAIKESGQRPTISRVAAITGLQRKEIKFLTNSPAKTQMAAIREPPIMRVVIGWKINKNFREANGRPRELAMEGNFSFRTLVETYAGDVTHVALLRELERLRWIRRAPNGRLILCATPAQLRARRMEAQEFASRLADLASALSLTPKHGPSGGYVGFRESKATDVRIGAALARTFSKRAEDFLDSFERWVSRSSSHDAGDTVRALSSYGIGIYLVEKKAPPDLKEQLFVPTPTRRAKRA